jgi:hypothetical protein
VSLARISRKGLGLFSRLAMSASIAAASQLATLQQTPAGLGWRVFCFSLFCPSAGCSKSAMETLILVGLAALVVICLLILAKLRKQHGMIEMMSVDIDLLLKLAEHDFQKQTAKETGERIEKRYREMQEAIALRDKIKNNQSAALE